MREILLVTLHVTVNVPDVNSNAEMGSGSRIFRPDRIFNGVKVFSATMVADRTGLGEKVTEWIARHAHVVVTEIVVTQSSDAQFHCIAISLFYWEPVRA